MAQIEPMDVDETVCEFDDKENSIQNSNVLPRTPCTEKGYEELDVSELNMKLHYSITPASSPMSRSYTNKESKLFNQDDSMSMLNDSSNLSHSLNSTLTKCETKPLKLPLQAIRNDFVESDLASSVRRSFDTDHNNCTITVDEPDNIDGHLLPSTSSSSVQTPEATTPTKDIPKDGGSPILRGLKSVLNLFRTSHGLTPEETPNKNKTVEPLVTDIILASTPLANKKKENNTSQRNSPLKESLVFSDDLEKELQWKDDSTIIFKHEKVPIHKLFYNEVVEQKVPKKVTENLDSTVEKMDISYNESMNVDKTLTEVSSNITLGIGINCTESDNEFVDCETFTNNVDQAGSEIKQIVITHKEDSYNQTKNEPNKEFQSSIEYELSPTVQDIESMSGTIEENASALNKQNNEIPTKSDKYNSMENELNPIIQDIGSMSGTIEENASALNKENSALNEYKSIESEVNPIVQDIESIYGTIEENASALNKDNNEIQTKSGEYKSIENELNPIIQDIGSMTGTIEYNSSALNEYKSIENDLNLIVQDIESISGTVEENASALNKENNEIQTKRDEYKSFENELNPILKDIKSMYGTIEENASALNKENNENQTKNDEYKSIENKLNPIILGVESMLGTIMKTSSTKDENIEEKNKNDEFTSNNKNELGPIVQDIESISGTIEKPASFINKEDIENQTTYDQSNIENIVSPIVQETALGFEIIEKTSINKELIAAIFHQETNNTDDDLIPSNISVSSNIHFERNDINNQLFNIGIIQDTIVATNDLNSTVRPSTIMEPSIDNFNTSLSGNTNEEVNKVVTRNEKLSGDKYEKMESGSKTSLDLDITTTLQLMKNYDQKELEINTNFVPISNIEKEGTSIEDLDATSRENNKKVNLTFDMDNMNTTIDMGIINHANGLVDLQDCNISTYLANIESVELKDNNLNNFINIEQVIENNVEESPNRFPKIKNNVAECALEIMNDVSQLELQFESINNNILDNFGLKINNEQLYEANISQQESPTNLLKTDAPSEIPLPVDEDIDKDSLTDTFIITNEDTENLMSKVTESSQNIDILPITTCPLQISRGPIETPLSKITETPDTNEIYSQLYESEIHIDQSERKYDIIENDVKNLSVSDISIESRTFTQIQQVQQTVEPNNKVLYQQDVSDLCSDQLETNRNLTEKTVKYFPVTDNSIEISTQVKSESSNNNLNFFDDASVNKSQIIMKTTTNSPLEKLHPLNANLEEVSINIQGEMVIIDEESSVSTAKKITVDEEYISSENKSPYTPVDFKTPYNNFDFIKEQYETTECEKMERESLASPPISPKLGPKGYNINFDDMDDPFATKTNIRLSPPLDSSPVNTASSHNQKEADLKRQEMQYRRKSLPVKKIRNTSKKPFNNSFDSAFNKMGDETSIIINSKAKSNIKSKDISIDDKSVILIKDINDLNIESPIPEVKITPMEIEICEGSSQNNKNKVIQELIQTQSNEENNTNTNCIVENVVIRNVFNLPEIDDINFNPFSSKSKLRQSPPPIFDNNITLTLDADANFQADKAISPNKSNVTCSSKNTDDKDNSVQEVNTEDEDTIEGPFFDADVLADIDKLSDDGLKTITQYEDFPVQNDDNKNDGELFIDAEAFEFLLNRNTNNVVLDSGKESLFLKFDPLLAKRVSSDGVLADLNEVQRTRRTPKKSIKETIKNDTEPMTAPRTSIIFTTLTEENQEEANAATSKPMMVVSPAVSSLVSPRKSTPPRINRRSHTFPSPAMVVIDRLLSLSGNTSVLEQDVTMTPPSRPYSETDIALAQLRDLLEEKHIEVQNLKSETEELNKRLSSMESQIRSLEKERDDHVNKINDLNESLAQKTQMNITMAGAVEEYEKTIVTLIAKLDEDKRRNAEERARIISERDEQTSHLASMETTFSDLHSKYEKSKQVILNMKANEDVLLKSHDKLQNTCEKLHQNYELLKQHASSKLKNVNQELDVINRAHQAEVLRLNAQVKRKDLEIKSLEESLSQKTKANEELTAICDELINNRLN